MASNTTIVTISLIKIGPIRESSHFRPGAIQQSRSIIPKKGSQTTSSLSLLRVALSVFQPAPSNSRRGTVHNAHIRVAEALFWMKSQNPRVLSPVSSKMIALPLFSIVPVTGLGSHSLSLNRLLDSDMRTMSRVRKKLVRSKL